MDWKDPAWYSLLVALLAFGISIPAAWSARKALTWQRDSADAAIRSAEAAEYANLLTERASAQSGTDLSKLSPLPATSDVSWRIERGSGSRYILRNTGTAIAEHVSVDAEQLGGLARRLPVDAVIRPGEGADILILSTWGRPAPNQLRVKWNDMQEYAIVPMPG
ncbi:hypothetical protein CIW52_06415 [Mycolicibacterium sp. P9-64]|uniref:hypothetical protein n=1 Tax=Mycolicibacterium sp. P9-64 TaxID=2024612 RepID=UPI0011EF9A68|nr:hypothetical protein [Mycolicibacterium sp. P9-64]KAA0085529.1 hypothetical protein CIW52_06415 [Mycolicibacterium sp. P9-64]